MNIETQKCVVCEETLLVTNVNMLKRLKVFQCKHTYHEECLQQSVGINRPNLKLFPPNFVNLAMQNILKHIYIQNHFQVKGGWILANISWYVPKS